MSIHVNTELLNAARVALAMLEQQGISAEMLRDAITASEKPPKRINRSADPDEQSPYSRHGFCR